MKAKLINILGQPGEYRLVMKMGEVMEIEVGTVVSDVDGKTGVAFYWVAWHRDINGNRSKEIDSGPADFNSIQDILSFAEKLTL